MTQAIVIGAGVVGCAAALELARRGVRTLLLEAAGVGERAASTRAAGILGAQLERQRDPAMDRLCRLSRERYPAWLATLRELGGGEVEYRPCGSLRVALADDEAPALRAEVASQRRDGLRAEWLDAAALALLEPGLARTAGAAYYLDDAVLDPPRLLAAARDAAERAGARVQSGAPVEAIEHAGARVTGVRLASGERHAADWVVLAAGSWSALLEGAGLAPLAVRPARGQMLELRTTAPPIARVVEGPGAYLSPRADGRVLCGSTVEYVGFEEAVTARAAQALLAGAFALVPALAEARLSRSWAGFRAATPDGLPILSPGPVAGLVLATGHFRNGVLLAPISGEIACALVLGEDPPVDLAPFSAARTALAGR